MKRFDLLRSPVLVALVALLVLNDFVLKPALHDWMTGKLSDFAGLAASTIFLLALWPRQARIVGASVCILFVFWKSPWSQGVIDSANAVSSLGLGRTVDWSDLIALPVVGLVCRTADRLPLVQSSKFFVCCTASVCLLAFTASGVQFAGLHPYGPSRTVELPPVDHDPGVEGELVALFDQVAAQYSLECSRCTALDVGRSYVGGLGGIVVLGRGDLEVSYDSSRRLIYYNIHIYLPEQPKPEDAARKEWVDAIDTVIQSALRRRFPTVAFSTTPPHLSFTYSTVQIETAQADEAQRAETLIENFLLGSGFRRERLTPKFQRFVQPPPVSAAELALVARISTHPLKDGIAVETVLTSASPAFTARQNELSQGLRQMLTAAFGGRPVSVRRSEGRP
ncbi:hypothetical protein [Reyranella sp.]|uniref:hypothetical protein n=1 Tax=Reyranella sp. TaxID=1929291 RepID=UPI003BADACD8